MKRVVIVRHAKAVPYGYEDDFNRDLTERGEKDAELVSRELKRRGIEPCVMISSPASRALNTALIFAETLGSEADRIIEMDTIYNGPTTSEFLELIRSLPDEFNTAFFFGHNPGFHSFTVNLLKYYNQDMPTCTAVGIDFNAERWEETEARSGELAFRVIPKMLK